MWKLKRVWLFLVVLILGELLFIQEAEARRKNSQRGVSQRRVAFGGKIRREPRRVAFSRSRRIGKRVGNRQVVLFDARNRRNDFDFFQRSRFSLDGSQVFDPVSSVALGGDPLVDELRLRVLVGRSNIAVDRFGRFFEQVPNRSLSVDRPLIFRDGKILGGAILPVRGDTLEQIRLFNLERGF